jgi:hypothetical protein
MLAIDPSQIMSSLEQVWEIAGASKDQLSGTMLQISQVAAQKFKMEK